MTRFSYHLKYWLPVYLYAGLIFFLSGISLPAVPVKVPFFDKWVHFVEYAVLSLLIYRACLSGRPSYPDGLLDCRTPVRRRTDPASSGRLLNCRTAGLLTSFLSAWLYRKRVFFSILASVLYGFSDELHQFFVPNRIMSEWDFLFDAFGAITAVRLISLFKKQRQNME